MQISFWQEVKDASDYRPLRCWLASFFIAAPVYPQLQKSVAVPFFYVLFWMPQWLNVPAANAQPRLHFETSYSRCFVSVKLDREWRRHREKRHDITADRTRATQNVVSGSSFQHPRQSLSLSSNCERTAALSSVVEHNLASVVKWQDMPALLNWARPMLSGTPSSSYLCKCSAWQCNSYVIFGFYS